MMDLKQLTHEAKEAESVQDYPKAVQLYEKLLIEDKNNEQALSRLMILYHKMKLYKKEISIINKAIRLQQQYYEPSTVRRGTIAELSKKLNLSTGLTNKKGEANQPEAISRLEKRKELVKKKL